MIEWAITSSVLILVVLTLRRLLMGKISLQLQYGLWTLVLVRLLVPVSVGGTAVSILNAVKTAEIPDPVVGYWGGTPPQASITEPDPSLSPEEYQQQYEENLAQWQAEVDAALAETGTPISLGDVLLGIWGAGSAGLGLWLLWVNVRFARNLRRSRSPLAADCPLPVYVTEAVQTPCLFGLLHPSIYVTKEAAAEETVLRHSLAHELTHYRHKDHIWAALRGLCLALHWYNPLVWLAAALSQRDGELCCDEATVRRLGEGERASYGRTLLAVTCQGRSNPLLTATSMMGSGIKERIVLLAKRPKTALYTLIAVVLVAAVTVSCTFTGAQGEDGELTVTLAEGIEAPQAVSDYARAYVEEQLTFYTEKEGYAITQAEIVGLTLINTGSAAENSGVNMYLLEYRLKAADPDQVVLAGGMSMEDGAITEWSSAGQPYLLLYWDDSGGETTWEPIQVTHTLPIEENYGTPEMLEEYGDAYTAAAMDLLQRLDGTVLTSADLDRDGEDEEIWLEAQSRGYYELVVKKQDGTELYRDGARTDHIGWNSLYLYTDSQGQASLLCYNPYSSTGLSTYSYTLFSLEGGVETVIQAGGVGFENLRASEKAAELIAFADEVNALLRRSALLLSTQEGYLIIGPEGRGDYLEHLSGVGDFLIEPDLEVYRSAFRPESSEGVNPLSAFFTSYYTRPEDLDFAEFLRYFPDDGTVPDDPEDPEFQALAAHSLWPYEEGSFISTPIHRYTRQSVDQVLEQYAGIATADLSGTGMEEVIYLEEYDAWYNFTSDYGPGMFDPVYGLREGSTVTLWELPSGNGTPGDVLTLEETEEGFRILSHLPGQ